MTRLQSKDLSGIASQLNAYDDELLSRTGRTLRQIACHAARLGEDDVRALVSGIRVGVVPIRWGLGVIAGFCEATAAILSHLGFDAFVTVQSDVAGLAEAYASGADVIFLSDDSDFVALNSGTHQYVHNSDATGKGFAAGLALMAGGLVDRKVLVLGCGAVGQSAISALLGHGARVSIYDIDSAKCRTFINSCAGTASDRLTVAPDLRSALAGSTLLVDASDACGIIRARDITPQTYIAAPGVPLGLTRNACIKIEDRLLHDPLQLGVATMGMEAVKQIAHQ